MKLNLYVFTTLAFCILTGLAYGQGCVAVRNMASSCSLTFDSTTSQSKWQVAMNYRYFHSYKHFVGTEEQYHRVEEGTNVINDDHSVLLGGIYQMNHHWSFSVIVPLIYINRSSLYEHKGNASGERYTTHSQGLGDIRIASYYSFYNTQKGNLTAGLGLKLPTGNYEYKDYFQKQDGPQYLPVDQSIQPGDGGWGITVEYDFTQRLAKRTYLYSTGLYLINPRNTNGVLRSQTLTDGIPLSNEMSVADQFMLRLGLRQSVSQFQFGLGARYEGVIVEDLIGKSDGFRRPGTVLSVEPSVIYTTGRLTTGVNVPIASIRNRTRSVLDKARTEATGTYRHGDAAFADWLLSVSIAYRL